MDKLYAVIDPRWGDPVVIIETIRKSPELAIAEAVKHPSHSMYASQGWDSMVPQGYIVQKIEIIIPTVEVPRMDRESGVDEILSKYLKRINDTPALLSLLYDSDMLPEQIISIRGAISVAAVVTAYTAGRESVSKEIHNA